MFESSDNFMSNYYLFSPPFYRFYKVKTSCLFTKCVSYILPIDLIFMTKPLFLSVRNLRLNSENK